MEDIVSAPKAAVRSDAGKTDEGGFVFSDTFKVFCIERDPFLIIPETKDGALEGLEPPYQLNKDWKDKLIKEGKTHEEAWKETNYSERYKDHLENSEDAQDAVFKVEMVIESNNVCITSPINIYNYSTRKIAKEFLQSEVFGD